MKKGTTQRIVYVSLIAACLFQSVVVPALAAPRGDLFSPPASNEEIKSKVDQKDQAAFEALKQATTKILDKAVGQLERLEGKISQSTKLDSATKQLLVEQMHSIEAQLYKYQQQLATVATLEELRALNQQVVSYIKDNKDVIKQTVQEVAVALGKEVEEAVTKLKQQVEAMLKVLKATCPSQKSTIEALESQLITLEKELANLGSAIKAKDATKIKQEVQTITQLAQQILTSAETIQSACMKQE